MKNSNLRYFLFFVLLFSFSIYSQSGKIVRIKDGDTVILLDSDNNQITLRLAEVDCPESSQAFGKKAKEFTANEVGNKMVSYAIIDTDRYGRYIAKIFYDNKYLSEEIIKNGYGWHYKKYSKSKKLSDLEIEARNKKLGLWYDKNPIEPFIFRKTNNY